MFDTIDWIILIGLLALFAIVWRWSRLVAVLSIYSLMAYALRSNIGVAQAQMIPQLGITEKTIGFIISFGFLGPYALFQLPAGVLGDRFGSRRVLGLAMLGMAIATLASGLVPTAAAAALATLLVARMVLGASQAATYPVGSMAVAANLPPEKRATANSIYIAAALIGSALVPYILAPLMVAKGWRTIFIASGVVAALAALLWYALAPRSDGPARTAPPLADQVRAAIRLVGNRDLGLLSVSYFLHSAVFYVFIFWFFRYLTEGRGFSILASGRWGSLPYFMAALLAPLGGLVADRFGRGTSRSIVRRRVAMTCLISASALIGIGANLTNPYLAIVALGFSVACINAAEGPFWATATGLGAANPGAAGGVINFMGNAGGFISTLIVPWMTEAWGWTAMLVIWAGIAVIAALLWLTVAVTRADHPAPASS